MNRWRHKILVSVLCVGAACSAVAQTASPSGDSLLYYKIGGGRHISIPPSLTITTIDLSASASWRSHTCGEFDAVASIEQSLDDLANGADEAVNAIENAVSSAIASLPGYILQKANPGLYDLFQNGLLRANEAFSLATKSCERMQHEIANNVNPYADWITMSWGDSWRQSIGTGEENIHEAEEEVKSAHNDGVTWIGGARRGGEDQEPIRVLSEVGGAGLNILSQRPPESNSDLPSSAPLRDRFSGPDEVGRWITDVLGEVEISICDSCESGKQPGRGLIPYIEGEAESVASALSDIVNKSTAPTLENLDRVSAPGVAISLQVVEAVQQLDPRQRSIVVDKLSQDIARARVIEEAFLVRRLLLTGSKEGNVPEMALIEVERALDELDEEIRLLTFEKDVRRSMISDTAVELLINHKAMNESSINVPALPPSDDRPLRKGTVK